MYLLICTKLLIFFRKRNNQPSSKPTTPNPTPDTSPTSPQPEQTTPINNSNSSNTTTPTTTPGPRPPDGPQSIEADGEMLPKYRRDLVAKQKILRAELNTLQPQTGHCRLEVSRSEIFEVLFCHFIV